MYPMRRALQVLLLFIVSDFAVSVEAYSFRALYNIKITVSVYLKQHNGIRCNEKQHSSVTKTQCKSANRLAIIRLNSLGVTTV